MKAHFVQFYSPGTFISESSIKPIDSWDIKKAIIMAKNIKERHNATPYAFRFFTKERTETELDSRETKTSGRYYLNGKISTLEEVIARNDPKEEILIWNMKANQYDKIVEKHPDAPGWKWTFPFEVTDVLIEDEFKPAS